MNQVQIDIVELELGEGAREGGFNGLAGTAGGFGGDEKLGARDAGAGDGGAELGFGAVGWLASVRFGDEAGPGVGVKKASLTFSTVKMVVAGFDGRHDNVDQVLV